MDNIVKPKAPYNFITLENKVLDRYQSEKDIISHKEYFKDHNSGEIKYEIEVITPMHISDAKGELFKNPLGQYVIPGNTFRGLTRFNASIFAFASVVNKSIEKYDIADTRFYSRNFASTSSDKIDKKIYSDKVGMKQYTKGRYKFTVLENVDAGYIKKEGEGYLITPAVKLENINTRDGNLKGNMHSYTSIHELELRRKNIKGINYLYMECVKEEHFKNRDILKTMVNRYYMPYYIDVNYNLDVDRPEVEVNGKFKGMLANSRYIYGKRHHYLVFREDSEAQAISITKEQAELYIDDLIRTNKLNKSNKEIESNYKYYALPEANEVKPVFFIKQEGKILFGFTPYLRLPANGSIYDGIPDKHRNYSNIDWVDNMFGWKGFRTKLSFLDAVIDVNSESITEGHKMILSEPKASWYKAYLKQKTSGAFESYNTENFEIRGRKFYWMNENADYEAMKISISTGKVDKLSSTIKCIREKTKISGRVKFENLTDEELGLLLYSLKQGDTDGNFNIGKGKPYGLGRCKIKIVEVEIEDIIKKYSCFNNRFTKKESIEKYIEAFKKYIKEKYNIEDVNELVSYKEFELSKRSISNKESSYMSLPEFSNCAKLPTLTEALGEKKDVISSKIGNKIGNSGQNILTINNNSNISGYQNNSKNTVSSSKIVPGIFNTSLADKLKNFKFDDKNK